MPLPPVFVLCRDCRFWDHKSVLTGSCRRHAPSAVTREFEVARWPETRPADGCGDGQAAIEDATAAQICETCLFWDRPGEGIDPGRHGDRLRSWWEQAGYCRRFAPLPGDQIGNHAFWRLSHATDRCFDGSKA